MSKFLKYIRPHLVFFIVGPICMLVEVVGEVVMPRLMAQIINVGIPEKNYGFIAGMGGLMVVTALFMLVGGVCGGYFASRAAAGFANSLRKDLFDRVQDFSFANIEKFSTGSLVTRLTNDVTQLQNTIRMALIMLLRAPGMLIGALIMAIIMNPSLAVIIAVVAPVLGIIIFTLIRTAYPRFGEMQVKLDRVNSSIQESLINVRVVKSFVRSDYEEARFAKANKELKDSGLAAFRIVIMNMPVMTLAMNITTLAVVWFGGRQIIVGDMLVGDLTAFTTYIIQILSSLMMLAMIILTSSRALACAKRIREVLDTEIDLNDMDAECKEMTVDRGAIEFKNVTFRYYKDREETVLDNVSFRINPGETVGIIGSTGSGKTSMVQLIPRLYDVDEGSVLVDGVDVRDYSLKHLREGVGMVLQKNTLFTGTIEENLRWGNEEATEEELYAAADAAQADAFVKSFTEGYATELGQGGVNVSGGQKQRLCIARALLKAPKILILDDSTSAVDTATEAKIRECFSTSLKGTTKLIIAQRISSVKDADKIIVLNEGRITGLGTHEELLTSCEEYQEIYYSQNERAVGA